MRRKRDAGPCEITLFRQNGPCGNGITEQRNGRISTGELLSHDSGSDHGRRSSGMSAVSQHIRNVPTNFMIDPGRDRKPVSVSPAGIATDDGCTARR